MIGPAGRVVLIINGLSCYYRLTIPVMYSRPYLTPLPASHRHRPTPAGGPVRTATRLLAGYQAASPTSHLSS